MDALLTASKLHTLITRLQFPCDRSAHCRCRAVLTSMCRLTQRTAYADDSELSRMLHTLGLVAEEMFLLHAPGLRHHQDHVSEFLRQFEAMSSRLRADNTSAKEAVRMTVATARDFFSTCGGGIPESFDDGDSDTYYDDAVGGTSSTFPSRDAERRADFTCPEGKSFTWEEFREFYGATAEARWQACDPQGAASRSADRSSAACLVCGRAGCKGGRRCRRQAKAVPCLCGRPKCAGGRRCLLVETAQHLDEPTGCEKGASQTAAAESQISPLLTALELRVRPSVVGGQCLASADVMAQVHSGSTYITGQPGSGKTTLLSAIALELLPDEDARSRAAQHFKPSLLQVAGSTGTAASILGACTLHCLLRMKPVPPELAKFGYDVVGTEAESAMRSFLDANLLPETRRILQPMQYLLLSEAHRFDTGTINVLDATLRRTKGIDKPWGGVRVVMEGDFLQLTQGLPLFHHPLWTTAGFNVHYLSMQHRTHGELHTLLQHLASRKNTEALAHAAVTGLRKLQRPLLSEDKAMHLFGTKARRHAHNVSCLSKLKGSSVVYIGTDHAAPEAEAQTARSRRTHLTALERSLDKQTNLSVEPLELKVGARVALLTNEFSRYHAQLCSGAIGTVTYLPLSPKMHAGSNTGTVLIEGMESRKTWATRMGTADANGRSKHPWPIVCFGSLDQGHDTLLRFTVQPVKCEVLGVGTRIALPLRLSFGATVHQAAGLTLSVPVVIHWDSFWPLGGLALTALSRVHMAEDVEIRGDLDLRVAFSRTDCVTFIQGIAGDGHPAPAQGQASPPAGPVPCGAPTARLELLGRALQQHPRATTGHHGSEFTSQEELLERPAKMPRSLHGRSQEAGAVPSNLQSSSLRIQLGIDAKVLTFGPVAPRDFHTILWSALKQAGAGQRFVDSKGQAISFALLSFIGHADAKYTTLVTPVVALEDNEEEEDDNLEPVVIALVELTAAHTTLDTHFCFEATRRDGSKPDKDILDIRLNGLRCTETPMAFHNIHHAPPSCDEMDELEHEQGELFKAVQQQQQQGVEDQPGGAPPQCDFIRPPGWLWHTHRALTTDESRHVATLLWNSRLYPPHKNLVTFANIPITIGTLRQLRPGVWLSDELINVYMMLLRVRPRLAAAEPAARPLPRCLFMTSHFYSKLTQQQGKPFCYRDVVRWLPSNGFDDYDLVLIPVHQQSHWTLAVINVEHKRFEHYDPLFGFSRSVLQNLRRLTLLHMRKSTTRHDIEQWAEVGWSVGQGLPAQVLQRLMHPNIPGTFLPLLTRLRPCVVEKRVGLRRISPVHG